MMLELAGHVVYDAADGAAGIELLNVVRPDVGIIDIGLPDHGRLPGGEADSREPHGRGMLLLALTGYGSAGDVEAFTGARVRLSPGEARRPRSSRAPDQRNGQRVVASPEECR